MRRSMILSLSVVFLLSLASQAFGAVMVKTREGKEIRLYKNSYALVIGNGNYTGGWDPLPGAVRDAKEVAAALGKHGFSVDLRTDLKKNEFQEALASFVEERGRDLENRLLFYYAGHGHTKKISNDEELGYLVMVDAPLPGENPVRFSLRSVDMQSLVTQAKVIEAKHVLFLFDSCFSGTILNLRNQPIPKAVSDNVQYPVRQFITAGRASEGVPDYSVFKQCFLNILEGREEEPYKDGYLTGEELGFFLKNKVPTYNACQHPQYGKIKDPKLDQGDFVFELASSGAVVYEPPGPAPVPSTGTLRISADVSGSRIYIDGSDRGGVPATLTLDPKTYRVEVRRSGYDSWRTNVTIEAGRTASLMAYLTAEAPRKARLYVNPTPSDSRIRILNIVPVYERGMELDPGSYHVEVSKDGYETDKRWVELAAGEDKYETFRLEKTPEAAGGGPSFTNSLGMKFVRIPSGSFMMGSTSSEPERDSDETQHRVTLTKPYYMQTTEVTVGQWRQFIRDSGYRTEAETGDGAYVWTGSEWKKQKGTYWDNPNFSQSDDSPVTCVSWNDCKEFVKWLNRKESMAKYRLPTEAEWEYACRAGTTTPFNTGNCLSTSEANYNGNYPYTGCSKGQYRQKTVSVASFSPNAWGLYDTHGNVWEWCSDWSGDYPGSAVTDPDGPSSGTSRVLRGGGWGSGAGGCRSAFRRRGTPGCRSLCDGFRLVRDF